MCETKITNDIRNYMQNDACLYEIDYGIVKENHIPWFGHHNKEKIEKLLDDIDAKLESNYIKAPVDSDGIPLHLWDEVTIDGLEGTYIIITMVYGLDGWVFGVNGNNPALYHSKQIHFNKISEESLMTDMVNEISHVNKLYSEGCISMVTTMRKLHDIEEKYRNLLKRNHDE